MRTHRHFVFALVALVLVVPVNGCAKKARSGDEASLDAKTEFDALADDDRPVDSGAEPKAPIGLTCHVSADCASGFCVDAVCCDTACTTPCFSCDQPATQGMCSPLFGAEDVFASPTCVGTRICSDDTSSPPSCVLVHPLAPIGAPCITPAECASQFCVDSVCCAAACSAPCFSCNQAIALGTCLPIYGAEDSSAIPPCAGTRACSNDTTSAPACKLTDGQECTRDADCINNHCRTYFFDHDGDGYGVTSNSIALCDVTPDPPPSYTSLSGDCCDNDNMSNPAVPLTSWFTTPNACGSYDWNCSGVAERQPTTATCPLQPAFSCGQNCVAFRSPAFTAACH